MDNQIKKTQFTSPVSADIIFPPTNGRAIPYSTNGVVDNWLNAPGSGTYVLGCQGGVLKWIETEEC